jgi:TFIIF-interacting CTD phosphatase-like protein
LEYYIKDLRLLLKGRDLKNMVLIDDKIVSYAGQLENGIPVPKYVG